MDLTKILQIVGTDWKNNSEKLDHELKKLTREELETLTKVLIINRENRNTLVNQLNEPSIISYDK